MPRLSQSRIGSDHWLIKALPDTSFPIAEGSWRAAGNPKRPNVRAETGGGRGVRGGWREGGRTTEQRAAQRGGSQGEDVAN